MADPRSALWIWDDSPYPITLRDFSQYIMAPMVARFVQQEFARGKILASALMSTSKLKIGTQLRIRLPENYEVRA